MCAHVLVAEDDVNQAELIRRYLEHEGHAVRVVHNGRAVLEEHHRDRPDLIVMDVMMPVMSGLEACRVLRAESDVAVLLLTARSTEEDLLAGLDLGADDYVTKPYSPRELMARVRTLLRRSRTPVRDEERVLNAGPITVDPARHAVLVDGEPVECTPVEFQLLRALAARPGRVLSRAQLLELIHGISGYITERTIDVHVKNLRRKIEPNPRRPVRLVTVYGVGYKLVGPERGR
ncbi:response regulator transcription factor [Nocardiopsis changdeensis]|uniref:Response regulator transcription factor n=1 Tax=Nocardiopsis changdeensis TaxID=2831969 RepID=A0ABX8BKS0_9ACTN|nr:MULTISPECIES: response regulator transcription factor [Nocardiopsis]QKW31551.1 response regulator transcription factor [Nocardiopsis flavescens]QUX22801.1 response regulator transcription factor [Nocardiopsis changdeensis]QYX38743.1 response regulator transcription factor [Nocardiopsis sp. MT53]